MKNNIYKKSFIPWFIQKKIKNKRINDFISNLSIVFVFNSISFFLQFCVLILIARIWGPVLYGKVNLVGNITALLFIPFSMGINNAMYKFLPAFEESNHRELIDTAVIGNIINVACLSFIFLMLYKILIFRLKIPFEIWICTILYTVTINFTCIFESFLRGKKRFADIGKIRLLSSFLFFCSVLILLFVLKKELLIYYYILYIVFYGFVFILSVIFILKISFYNFRWKLYLKIYRYGILIMLGLLVTALIYNSDIIILNYFTFDKKQVGIFASYQGIIKLVFYVGFYEIFTVVFLPTIANTDKKTIFKKIRNYWILIFLSIFLISVLIILITVLIFGKKYVFSPLYLFLSSLSISIFSIFQIYNTLISMEGEKGAKISLIVSIIVLPVAICSLIFFTYQFGITGTMISLIVTNFLLMIMIYIFVNKFYKKNNSIIYNEGN